MSVLSAARQKGLSRKRGAGVPGGKKAEYMRVDQGVESSRTKKVGAEKAQGSGMSKRRKGQKEGDETKNKAKEAEGEDRDRKGKETE